ncbi:Ktr system potassium uptake protein D [Brevibacillus reuszeri]|uniref:ATP synthase n=1 Tax=Brevibacillus reuszeri TaxID=54915 RepID=A0A0K9Z222_9BACL|nr:TrkH family potassium uptake protein [Brevibacillus reuszeri]KNB74505.1 ATP synthase [Brevibacillus reuszeri]MED1856432.1 TrkH family potassium uptake protein [Brevibacillus reuszeri]GED67872.1 Ktr system potassium uptake protein D [Brevibacillus reuszeri]
MLSSNQKRRLTSVQIIVFFYVGLILSSSFLLLLPFFHNPGAHLTFIDSLFTAASAISVTGLTVITIHEVFNEWGILFLTLLFQVGGIGIMTLGTFFWLLMGQKIGLEHRMWIATDHNRPTLSGLVDLMRNILVIAIMIELVGTILLGTHFMLAGYYTDWYSAYYHGYFAAVSSFTNAGFDLYGNSMMDFTHDYVFQSLVMLLIICGAIGFPVLVELRTYLSYKRAKMRFTFSLFTKITTLTFFSLIIIGAVLLFLFEHSKSFAGKTWVETLFFSLFHSVSSRSGGLATMDISLLSTPSLLMLSAMMFIGASPSSVGGGIRTTTFFVLVATVFANMRGFKNVKVFGRELVEDDIMRSFVVFFIAIIMVFTAVILLVWLEDLPFQHILFEVCSAFGTTGLSTGITSNLSAAGKVILIVTMVIGRIGIINLLLFLKRKDRMMRYRHPKERVIIGQ